RQAARTTAATRPMDARGCIARRILSRFVDRRHFRLIPATFSRRGTSHCVAPAFTGTVPVPVEVIYVPLVVRLPPRRHGARRAAAARNPSRFGARVSHPRSPRGLRFHGL